MSGARPTANTGLKNTVLAPFVGRYGHVALAANGRAWVIGGFDGDVRQDVWSTADGVNWTEATCGRGIHARATICPASVSITNCGSSAASNRARLPYVKDIWSSADGQTWSLVNATAAYGANFNNKVVMMGTNLWLIGGDLLREVWSSPDGANWTQINAGASFPVRSWFQALAFNNQLWVIGGFNGNLYNGRLVVERWHYLEPSHRRGCL